MSDPRRGDDELPLDSDVEVDDIAAGSGDAAAAVEHPERRPHLRTVPVHFRPRLLLLVGIGGAAGTLARFEVQQSVAPLGVLPVITVAINIAGAFLLGLLLETLLRRGPDVAGRRALRLLLGTGALGGFTTYSALSVDTVNLFRDGLPGLALLYGVGTVVLGALGTALGIAVGVRANRRRNAAGSSVGGAR